MNKLLQATAAVLALTAAVPAVAADLPPRPYTKAPPYTAPALVHNWTGFYIGGHLGGAFGDGHSRQGTGGRFLGGVEGGVVYRLPPSWVVGAEAQSSWPDRN